MEETSSVLPSVIEAKKKRLGDTKFVIGIDDLTISNTTTPQQQQQRQQEQQLPPPEGITNSLAGVPLRRPYRHHAKRRVSRMHMAKAQNLTDSEAEVDNKSTVTTVDMRRSQSQRSLLPRQQYQPQPRRSLTQELPLALDGEQQEQRRNSTNSYNSSRSNSPAHYFVSQQQMAAPIEQTFNAVANNLVAPNGAAYPACVHAASSPVISLPASPRGRQPATSSSTTTKPLLRSQFITNNYNSKKNRNKQQRQENDEEETPCITQELDRIDSEYQCLKQYRDPMMESLVRCVRTRNDINKSKRHPPIRSSTYHSSSAHRTMSTSAIVTSNNYTNNDSNVLLHSGHHQIAVAARRQQQQRRQQLIMLTTNNNRKRFVSSPTTPNKFSSSSFSSSSSPRIEWNKRGGTLSALWDRMMHNVNS